MNFYKNRPPQLSFTNYGEKRAPLDDPDLATRLSGKWIKKYRINDLKASKIKLAYKFISLTVTFWKKISICYIFLKIISEGYQLSTNFDFESLIIA